MADIEPIHFTPGNVDITLTPPAAPAAVGAALASNQPFPDEAFTDGAIALGSIGAEASKDFTLDKVKFIKKVEVGGKLFAGLGVYRSGDRLADDLKAQGLDSFDEPAVGGPLFPEDEAKNLYALRWGYDAKAAVSGSLPLGGPKLSFGASARAAGLYAVVRSQDRSARALDAVTDTLHSWKMPRQVSAPGDLKPGTWLVAETDGSLSLSLGVEYGYDYSWVRESLKLGGLTGDLGLKIEMGVKAQLGFSASGRYATVISRESDREELRLRVFRMRQHGWTFALDASVSARAEQDLIPDNFDDFVKGVFNVNGNQALADIIEKFDKWTNPNNKLKDLLGAELVKYAEDMVEKVTGRDLETAFDEALEKLKKPLALWRDLPHEMTSMLYGLLKRQGVPLDDLRDFLRRIEDETDPQKLADEIAGRLSSVKFFETPVGMWLSAVAKEGVLSLLANVEGERQRVVELAKKAAALLDGSEVEDTLRELQKWIEGKLGLDKILAVTELNFDQIDAWLKKRLSDFLGKTVVVEELEKVKDAINRLRESARKFYAKGFEALTRKYTAEFHFSYSKETTRTALIDLTFDFAENAPSAGTQLKAALRGDFSRLLSEQLPGVKLNKGVLTHGMKRRTHIEVALPYYGAAVTHITESLAAGEAVDSAEGRLWVFTLNSKDVVTRRQSVSKLAISLQFTRKAGVRDFSGGEFRYDYQLRAAKPGARRSYLAGSYTEAANRYFPSVFATEGPRSFSTYLTELDKALDGVGVGGSDFFGNVLSGLDVSVPGEVFAAWKKAPTDRRDRAYMLMSRRVQNVLRHLLPVCYFRDLDRYRELPAAYPLVVYSALPGINRLRLRNGKLEFTEAEVYDWDFESDEVRRAVFDQYCEPRLRSDILPRIREELSAMPDTAALYADSKIKDMRDFKLGSLSTMARNNFKSLARNEADVIPSIRQAALDFRASLASNDLAEAVERLDKFGARLVQTFNHKLGDSRYEEAAFRPLGALLLLEATYYLHPATAEKVRPAAMLEFIILKRESTFALESYLNGARPEAPEAALQQRIVSVSGQSL